MNRFSKKYFYYHLLVDIFFGLCAGFSVMAFIPVDEETGELLMSHITFGIIALGVGLSVYLLLIIYHYLYYRTSSYFLDEKGIVCRRGVIFKNKSFLEYQKIHAINKKQGLIQKIFDVATLIVDSGSTNTAYTGEIVIIESGKAIDDLVAKIKKHQDHIDKSEIVEIIEEENKERKNLYDFNSKKRFLYAALESIMIIFVFTLILVISIPTFLILSNYVKEINEGLGLIFIFIFGSYFGLSIFIFLGYLLSSFLGFYNYKLYKDDNSIDIDYGLFEKKNNDFKISRVKGVKIRQNFIKRLFKYVSIEVEVIGYGQIDNNQQKISNSSVLVPLCKESEVEFYLSQILDEYIPLPRQTKAKSYFAFFSWQILISGIVFLVLGILSSIWLFHFNLMIEALIIMGILVITYILVIVFNLIDKYLMYKNESVAVDQNKITIYHGGFSRYVMVILKDKIIGIDDVTTPLRKKKGIYSYIIHFRSNSITNKAYVDIMDEEVKDKLLSLIRF